MKNKKIILYQSCMWEAPIHFENQYFKYYFLFELRPWVQPLEGNMQLLNLPNMHNINASFESEILK